MNLYVSTNDIGKELDGEKMDEREEEKSICLLNRATGGTHRPLSSASPKRRIRNYRFKAIVHRDKLCAFIRVEQTVFVLAWALCELAPSSLILYLVVTNTASIKHDRFHWGEKNWRLCGSQTFRKFQLIVFRSYIHFFINTFNFYKL